MSDKKIVGNSSGNEYKTNNDIEDILSNEFNTNVVVNKKLTPSDSTSSFNVKNTGVKKIDIGLDLLMNPEKDRKNKDDVISTVNLAIDKKDNSGRTSAIQFEAPSVDKEFNFANMINENESNINDLINDIQKETSINMNSARDDIRSNISNNVFNFENSSRTSRVKPQLFNDSEVENFINEPPHQPRRFASTHDDDRSIQNNNIPQRFGSSVYDRPQMIDLNAERKEKEDLLAWFRAMEKLGVQGIRRFNMSNDIQEMRDEKNRIKSEREMEKSIKFQRKCLMAFTSGVEWLNGKFEDYTNVHLDGWSDTVLEGIDEYNEIFMELHEKYKEKVKLEPEVKLMLTLGGSAFMFHMTNSMFKTAPVGMEDIIRNNPDLMKQFTAAAMQQMNPNQQGMSNMFSQYNQQPSYVAPPPPQAYMRPTQPQPVNSIPVFQPPSHPQPQPKSPLLRDYSGPSATPVQKQINAINNNTSPIDSKPIKKIPAPTGADDILQELLSNTDKTSVKEDTMSTMTENTRRRRNDKNRNVISLSLN